MKIRRNDFSHSQPLQLSVMGDKFNIQLEIKAIHVKKQIAAYDTASSRFT